MNRKEEKTIWTHCSTEKFNGLCSCPCARHRSRGNLAGTGFSRRFSIVRHPFDKAVWAEPAPFCSCFSGVAGLAGLDGRQRGHVL